MDVLITGGAGFVGHHLVKRCILDGHNVRVIDDLSTGLRRNLESFAFNYIEDINKVNFEPFQNVEVIFHLAAKASIPWSIENPIEAHNQNVGGVLWVLELARKIGAKVIYSSSSSVGFEPITPYSLQKKIGEDYLKLYSKLYGVKGVVLRYFNVFGEGQETANGGETLVLSKFLAQKKRNEPFTIVGSGEQRRDFVYVGDVVEANLKAMECESFGIFNIGSGKNYSVNEVADMIDRNYPIIGLPPRVEPFEMKANIKRTKSVLGWSPKVKIKEWIKQQV